MTNKSVTEDEERAVGAADDEPDLATVNRVYRKLDWRIIPPFWILYFICSAIRSNVGLAQTMNIGSHHDLASVMHLNAHQVSTSLALFYVCYVVFDLPSNLAMTRLSPRVWMSRIVIGVGVIGSCLAAAHAAWSLYLLRLLLGLVIAGMWPGMTYYLTLFYPPERTAKRIGQYFSAAQISAAVVGLVSAGFQRMDGDCGLVGFQWMFLIWGLAGIVVGIALLWWLPERPRAPEGVVAVAEGGLAAGQSSSSSPSSPSPPASSWQAFLHAACHHTRWLRRLGWLVPRPPPALRGADAAVHYRDLSRVYRAPARWGWRDLGAVLADWRLWPLVIMYFGVVGVGIGVQSYASVIIQAIDPGLSDIDLSLLTAPIWLMDFAAILLITPFSDRFHHHRAAFFSVPVLIQIAGLLVTTFAAVNSIPTSSGAAAASSSPPRAAPAAWARYAGLLLVGFGLGPTVPICMTWTAELFQPVHGDLGVAAASAAVSGLGNLGSIVTTYALYEGWAADRDAPGGHKFRRSNLVMVGMLGASLVAAFLIDTVLRFGPSSPFSSFSFSFSPSSASNKADRGGRGRVYEVDADGRPIHPPEDAAAKREVGQRGFSGLFSLRGS